MTATLQCPAWCDDDHTITGNSFHCRVVAPLISPFALVFIEADDGQPARIYLNVPRSEETLSPKEAVQVADALRKAAEMVGEPR